MDWTLERLNVPRSFIVLSNNEQSYTCGRCADSKIICPSLVVSRRHCIFLRVGDTLSVIDLKSSNGVFVNNKLIDPDLLVPLKENDVIGIGCAGLYRDNEPMYVYKLHKGNLGTRNLENFDELLTQRKPAASVAAAVSSVDKNSPIKNSRDCEIKKLSIKEKETTKLGTKRNLNGIEKKVEEGGNIDDCGPPPFKKANKIVGRKEVGVSDKNANLLENCLKEREILERGSGEDEKKDEDKEEEEEIQEIWSTMKSPDFKLNGKITSEVSISSEEFLNGDLESNTKDKKLNRRLTLDLKEKEKEKEKEKVKEEVKTKKKVNKTDDDSKNEEDNNKKSLIKTKKNDETKKKLSNNVEKNLKKGRGKNIKKITDSKETNDNEEKMKKNKIFDKLSSDKDIVNSFPESSKSISIPVVKLKNIDSIIEKNVHKEKEKGFNDISKVDDKLYKKDRNSFISREPNATSSPFKLKMVKQEPSTSFSIVDTVDLSDDDEDIFPSSQLFDSVTEIDKESTKLSNNQFNEECRIKVEEDIDVKEENSYDDYSGNRDNDYDYKDVITISDNEDEDEDNRWLIRLSESQRIKEENPEISESIEFFDEMIKVKEDLESLVERSGIPNLDKEKDEDKTKSKSLKILSITEIEKELFENDSIDGVGEKIIPLQSEDKKSPQSLIDKKISSSIKGPEIIEPLPLPQKKRRSMEEKIVENPVSESPSTSTSRSSKTTFKDCVIRVAKLPNNLTLKEKRNLQLKDKLEEKKYEDEQRLRRSRNKWAQGVPLPIGKRRVSLPITKKQKLDIVNERKEKLKALAKKPKDKGSAGPSNVERVAAKPKAKVSLKSRGDFLIDESLMKEIENAGGRKKDSRKKKTGKKSRPKDDDDDGDNRLEIPRRENDDDVDDDDGNKAGTSKSSFVDKRVKKMTESRPNDSSSSTQKENRVPNSFDKDKKLVVCKKDGKKIGKKVTFRDDLTTVREFQIEANNTLKKIVGKDALIPKEKLPTTRKIYSKEGNPKIEEFLRFIFMWNPSWLDEQKRLKSEPPIVGNDVLVPLLTNYKSYKDYYQVMIPLFLVELWHVITKEFDNIDNRCDTVFCSVVTNSVTSTKIQNSNTTLTTMMLEMIASNDDIRRQKHPDNGNLVFLELCYRNNEGKLMFLKVFAYVTYVHRSNITPHTFFNRELTNYVKNPSYVLTYTILTKPLKVTCCENRVLRLRRVTYLRSNLRTVQALQALPSSPLMNAIVDPRIEQYQFSPSSSKRQSSLITGDKLNGKQLEAVLKITETIVKKEAKICLVQGPPGTGKSHVIVNLVMQTLYGENRYENRELRLRILLCAPSNAAIDEIVLRLLDRRAKLTNDRFKMVRVGISNSMHPRVRDISVEELAKRDLKKTIKGYQSSLGQSMDSVEEEKRFIEARINALQSQITSNQKKDDSQTQYLRTKLLDMRAKYDLIKNCIQSSGNNIDTQTVAKQQRSIETKILNRADIIACTLSSCYTNLMESTFGGNENCISVCIVDEATQSCEADTLIPLMLGVNTLVLVGDPAQLPATIISQRAKKLGLDQSLFSRIQRAFECEKNNPVIMLDVQYRMDPSISHWPNKYFYGGKLRDAYSRNDNSLTAGSSSSSFPLKPYTVLDVDTVQNPDKFSNNAEADFVVNLIKGIIEHFDERKIQLNNFSIGVITPYRKQQILVQEKMNERVLPLINNHLKGKIITQVNTVDSFQGHERDLIIMSCVRTNGIGFMSDRQRLCVALTRAKSCLILCGNFATFQRDTMWSALLSDANFRKKYIRIRSDAKPNEIISNLVK